jgi:Uma2 family endonuclease
MAAAPQLAPPADQVPTVYRFTVQQYHAMMEAGVLGDKDRTELLEGWVVPEVTHNPPHDTAVDLILTSIAAVLPSQWRARGKSAVTTAESGPEPDVAVVRGPARRYSRSHPRPTDIAVVVEVVDTTLRQDRAEKMRIYARARIPVYWIVNLTESQVEVYSHPRAGKTPTYGTRTVYGIRDSVPLVIAGHEVTCLAVRDLLP